MFKSHQPPRASVRFWVYTRNRTLARADGSDRTMAREHEVFFKADAFDGDDSLMVIEIERRFLTPDAD